MVEVVIDKVFGQDFAVEIVKRVDVTGATVFFVDSGLELLAEVVGQHRLAHPRKELACRGLRPARIGTERGLRRSRW